MKKFGYILLSLILCLTGLTVAGCSKDKYDDYTVDLSKLEVGAEIPVYPNCEFDYVLTPTNEEFNGKEITFHINSIAATLSGKNYINEGDVVKTAFYPFEITVHVSGQTDITLAGKTISVYVCAQTCWFDIGRIACLITRTGSFDGSVTFSVFDIDSAPLYFNSISII